MPLDTPLIEVKNLSFAYNGNAVLDHVSFKVDKGDYVGIIGPNGGGKTTLLKILIGLLKPDSGSVAIANTDIGYVPQRIAQDSASFPATVWEIVESGRIARKALFEGMDDDDRKAIKRAMDIAKIADLKNKQMSSLSGGQRQRVYVARALASEPQILILDEPFVGVDIATETDFYAFLKELNEQEGLTIIFVSHDIDVVTEEAKSVLCLNKSVLSFGPADELQEQTAIETLYGKRITHIHHAK
jgi:zinc transport system ATP-binding protein